MKRTATLALGCLAATPALAQPSDAVVGAFVETCVDRMPQLDRVRDAARTGNWKSVDGDMGVVLGPPLATSASRIWFVKQTGGQGFFVGIGRGTVNGRRTAACSVANPQASQAETLASLTNALGLKAPVSDRESAGERMRIWNRKVNGKNGTVLLANAGPTDAPGVTLTVMAPEN